MLHWSLKTLPELENGNIEIGINHYPLAISKGIRQIMVQPETYSFVLRKDHPAIASGLPIDVIAKSELVGLIVPELTENQAIVTTSLRDRGFNFILRSEHLGTLFSAVENSDAIFVVNESATNDLRSGLVKLKPDWLSELPQYSVALFMQQSQSQTPLHKWLTKEIRKVIIERMKRAIEH